MQESIRLPGLIDLHVHLRQPGTNHAETIASGSQAAVLGGYALVADMPNNPGRPTWDRDRVLEKQRIIRANAYLPIAINAGCQPEADTIGELEAMMPLAISLKGYGGKTTGINRQRDYDGPEFEPIVAELHRVAPDKPFLFHAGEHNLPYMIYLVAKRYGHHLHVCHVNDPAQVELVTDARQQGLPVTCGVCPHHLLKTSHDRTTEGKFAEMQPPLAHQTDAEKLMRLLADGHIQMIETDHAPHTKAAKQQAEHSGGDCFGVPGIEHAVKLMLYQVKRGNLTIERLVDAMSTQPAALFGLRLGPQTLSEWKLVDSRIESETDIVSGACWTPYLGMNTLGELVQSRVGGKIIYKSRRAVKRPHRPVMERGSRL